MGGNQLAEACASVRDLFDAQACICAVVVGDQLSFAGGDGRGVDSLVGSRLPIGEGIAGFVAQTGLALEVPDTLVDGRLATHVPILRHYVPRAVISAPLLDTGGEVLGTLHVLDPSPDVVAEAVEAVGGVLSLLRLVASDVAELLDQLPVPDSV